MRWTNWKWLAGCGLALALVAPANAALVQHNTFDVDGTASVGTNATLGGSTSIVGGTIGNALSLPGSVGNQPDAPPDPDIESGAVLVGDTGIAGTAARTVAFWFKGPSTQDTIGGAFVSWGAIPAAGARFEVRTENAAANAGKVRLEINAGFRTVEGVVADDLWHHIAVVMNAGDGVHDADVYVDGVLAATAAQSGGNTAINTGNVSDVLIGQSFQDELRNLSGLLDDFRIYDNALTANEVAALVPEPASMALLGLGGLMMLRRRRVA